MVEVVEVELAHHPLHRHYVLPQVQVLATAEYGASEVAYLARQNPAIAVERLSEMVRVTQPRVLVLVNAVVPEWLAPLEECGASVGVVEIFRSSQNRTILRVNGQQPEGLGSLVSDLPS